MASWQDGFKEFTSGVHAHTNSVGRSVGKMSTGKFPASLIGQAGLLAGKWGFIGALGALLSGGAIIAPIVIGGLAHTVFNDIVGEGNEAGTLSRVADEGKKLIFPAASGDPYDEGK
jgi:hypothetical protein